MAKRKPTAEHWEQAVANIHAHYPPNIFPPDSDSPDAKAGTWARQVCLNIITEAWRIRTDRAEAANHRRWHGPEAEGLTVALGMAPSKPKRISNPPESGSTLPQYDGRDDVSDA